MFYTVTENGLHNDKFVSRLRKRLEQKREIETSKVYRCQDCEIPFIEHREAHEFDFINLYTLKSRGWTNGLINKYLGAPSFHLENPHNHRHHICCYTIARVRSAESNPQFQSDLNYKKKVSGKMKRTLAERKSKQTQETTQDDQLDEEILFKIDSKDLTRWKFPRSFTSFYQRFYKDYSPKTYKALSRRILDSDSLLRTELERRGFVFEITDDPERRFPVIQIDFKNR